MMDINRDLFLPALNASLKNEEVSWEESITEQEWAGLFASAGMHQVTPMIYEAVYRSASAAKLDPQFFRPFKEQTIWAVMMQTMKTEEFLNLYEYLHESGLCPLVVKGIVCRSLYPRPDYRLSGDEDLLVSPNQFERCHQAMLDYGMQPVNLSSDIDTAFEITYQKPGTPSCIEMHKSLFPPDSAAYGELNRFFEGVFERPEAMMIDGRTVMTMDCTDHLLYLICHALKHFLHSGFGIRQVCDISLFANAYGSEIDWLEVLYRCREAHADFFAAALFRIGQKYLTFDPETACWPQEWRKIRVDEEMLLNDLLDAGIYGGGTMSRKHSSGITLNAVTSGEKEKKWLPSVLKTVFPPVKSMETRYPYLKKNPCLLPAAWISRILKYHQEIRREQDNDAVDALAIGKQRIELLKQYKILG